jgi:hypothetical protein
MAHYRTKHEVKMTYERIHEIVIPAHTPLSTIKDGQGKTCYYAEPGRVRADKNSLFRHDATYRYIYIDAEHVEEYEPKAQHKSPCSTCAFRRDSPSDRLVPGTLGGSAPHVYVGQCHGPFWIPCHMTYDGKIQNEEEMKRNPQNRECAGAAIMRANTGDDQRLPAQLLHLPPDKEAVFATYAEFLAHHYNCSIEQAQGFLDKAPPELLMKFEMHRAGVQRVTHLKKEE